MSDTPDLDRAREAAEELRELAALDLNEPEHMRVFLAQIERRIAEAVTAEREACLKIVTTTSSPNSIDPGAVTLAIALAIRARGSQNKEPAK